MVQQLLRQFRRVCKAVDMQIVLLRYVLAKYSPDIVICFSRMYRYRLLELDGQLELPYEHLLLDLPRRVVVVVVEADLP